jgi:hypothetical protein
VVVVVVVVEEEGGVQGSGEGVKNSLVRPSEWCCDIGILGDWCSCNAGILVCAWEGNSVKYTPVCDYHLTSFSQRRALLSESHRDGVCSRFNFVDA